MPKKPISVGIIGCGAAFEQLYHRPLRNLFLRGLIKVSLIVENNEQRKEKALKSFPEAVGFNQFIMDRNQRIDLAIILSPPTLHTFHAKQAFEHGAHVLCEKPLAHSVESGLSVAESAVQKQRLLGVGMTRRYYPALFTLKKLVATDFIGRIYKYVYREGGNYSWPIASPLAFKRNIAGGGVLLDKGVHAIDSLCWLFGKANLVNCLDDSWTTGVESNAILNVNHSHIAGYVQLSWSEELNNLLIIYGEKGELMLPIGPLHDLFYRRCGENWQRINLIADWPTTLRRESKRGMPRTYYECIQYQLIQMLRAIVLGEDVPVNAQEALETLALIEGAYKSSLPLYQTWLSDAENDLAKQNHWRSNSVK